VHHASCRSLRKRADIKLYGSVLTVQGVLRALAQDGGGVISVFISISARSGRLRKWPIATIHVRSNSVKNAEQFQVEF
jgi:hypothetical protein